MGLKVKNVYFKYFFIPANCRLVAPPKLIQGKRGLAEMEQQYENVSVRSFFKTNLQKRQIEFPYENGFIEFS